MNTTPSLKDLYEHITPQYAADWKVIGTLLDLPSAELRAIEAKFPTNVKWCCNQMLEKWLGLDTTASWGKLFTIIESLAISGQVSDKEMFKKLYYQVKHDLGTEQLQLYKLVIFGPPGVGKSSLFQVLLGSNPDPVRSSTGVLYRKLVQAEVAVTILAGQSKSSWHLLSIDNEILQLRSTIKRVVEKPKQVEVTLPTTVDVATSSYKSQMKVEEKLFQPSTEVSAQIQYASTLMACYDSGGQPEFFDIMPALMIIATGNIMVFDLSKDIHLKIKSEFYEKSKSSGLAIRFAIYNYNSTDLELKQSTCNIVSIKESTNDIDYIVDVNFAEAPLDYKRADFSPTSTSIVTIKTRTPS